MVKSRNKVIAEMICKVKAAILEDSKLRKKVDYVAMKAGIDLAY